MKIMDAERDLARCLRFLYGKQPTEKQAARIEQLKQYIAGDKRRLAEYDNQHADEQT